MPWFAFSFILIFIIIVIAIFITVSIIIIVIIVISIIFLILKFCFWWRICYKFQAVITASSTSSGAACVNKEDCLDDKLA